VRSRRENRAFADFMLNEALNAGLSEIDVLSDSDMDKVEPQQRLRTPTGPFFARFFIGIILGLVAEFAFMTPSRRLTMSSFAARWMGRKQNVGGKFRHGCSTGRHALTLPFDRSAVCQY
jgi:hypothetical protein